MDKLVQPGWHVLYVRSRQEKKVYDLLIEEKLEAFLPLITKIRKWSDRKKKITIPLFSSYVFVHIKSPMDFYKALNVHGACAYIRFNNKYAHVRQEEINRMKILIGSDEVYDITLSSNLPRVGEIKEIKHGPMTGLECEVLRINDQHTIKVRIESLKQDITAVVPSYYFSELSNAV